MSDGNDNLRSALRALTMETRGAEAGAQVRSNLLKEMRRRQRKALVMRWWPAAAVAAMLMGVWLGMPRTGAPVEQRVASIPTQVVEAPSPEVPAPVETPRAAPERTARPATYTRRPAAKQLRALTPWYIHPGIPEARQGHMVYMEVGPETARLFGLVSTGPLQAEVFLGDDGLARAIRLVRTTQIAKGE